jgi:hypothetical protein
MSSVQLTMDKYKRTKQIHELSKKYEASKYQVNAIQICFNSLHSKYIFEANPVHPEHGLPAESYYYAVIREAEINLVGMNNCFILFIFVVRYNCQVPARFSRHFHIFTSKFCTTNRKSVTTKELC